MNIRIFKAFGVAVCGAVIAGSFIGCASDEDKIRDTFAKIDKDITPKVLELEKEGKSYREFMLEHCDITDFVNEYTLKYISMFADRNEEAIQKEKLYEKIKKEIREQYEKEDKENGTIMRHVTFGTRAEIFWSKRYEIADKMIGDCGNHKLGELIEKARSKK